MTGIYELTLTSSHGRERKMLAYLPTEETRRNFLTAAEKRGVSASLRSQVKNEE